MLRNLSLIVVALVAIRCVSAQETESYVPVSEDYQLPIPITLAEQPVDADSNVEPSQQSPAPQPIDVAAEEETASGQPASQLRLPPRPSSAQNTSTAGEPSADAAAFPGGPSGLSSTLRTLSSLGIVLGLFFVFMRLVKRSRVSVEPEDQLFDTLGRVTLLGKRAHIVRFGSKLLVLAKTQNGLEKLTELSNPQDVERIVTLCRGGSNEQLNRGLRDLLGGQNQHQAA